MRSCSSGQCHPPTTVHAGYAPRFPESAVGTIPCAALIIMSTSTRNTRPAHPSKRVHGGRHRLPACVPRIRYARRRKKATHREHHRLMHQSAAPEVFRPLPDRPIATGSSGIDCGNRYDYPAGRRPAGALCHSRTANRWPRSTCCSPSGCARDVRGGLVSVVPFSAKI